MPTNPIIPDLDDRRWSDLVEEARALIPLHAPTWTDHNAHDPGLTIIELYAWIAEMDLFTLNQVTGMHRRKLLALAGQRPRPPRASETTLTIGLAAGSTAVELPAGFEFEGRDAFDAPHRWRSLHDEVVQPGALGAVLSHDRAGLRDLTDAWRRGEPLMPFGPDPRPGDAFYLGFDLPTPWPVGTVVSVGLLPAAPDGSSGRDARRLVAASGGDMTRHHSVTLRWDLLTGPDAWTDLAAGQDVEDDTRAMTLDGRVVLRIPAGPVKARLGRSGPLAWIRARVANGAYDAAPVVRGLAFNAVDVEQAVPATRRLPLAAWAVVSGQPPAPGTWAKLDLEIDERGDVARLEFNSAIKDAPLVRVIDFEPRSHLTIEAAAVVRGTGEPLQAIEVASPPLVEESVRVFEHTRDTWRAWTARADFDASGRADSHVVIDPVEGTITVGDGEHGRVASSGSTLLVVADITSAGAADLGIGMVDRVAASVHNAAVVADLASIAEQLAVIGNVVPGAGGSDAETIDAAIARVREAHLHANRAVVVSDFETLTMETPGTRVARVEVRPNLHPGFPCVTAPGIVTALVLPSLPLGRPTPSAGLVAAIARHLGRSRVIGTRVEVVGPTYATVVVRATVTAAADARVAVVEASIRERLAAFFDPLSGGPWGTGWPFGRDIHRAEVLAIIDGTVGVANVAELDLVDEHGCSSCGDLCVGPLGLVASGVHEIEVRETDGRTPRTH